MIAENLRDNLDPGSCHLLARLVHSLDAASAKQTMGL